MFPQMRPPAQNKESSSSVGSLSEGSNDNKSVAESTTPESMSAEEEEDIVRQLRELQDVCHSQ